MKNIFEVSQEEKNRILGLHESATKKHYIISEQEDEITQTPVRVEYDVNDITLTGIYQDGELYVTFPNSSGPEKMPSNMDLTTGSKKVTEYPQLIRFNEMMHKEGLERLYATDSENPPSEQEKKNDLLVKMRTNFHVPTYQMVPEFNPVGVICSVDNSRILRADVGEETTPGRIVS